MRVMRYALSSRFDPVVSRRDDIVVKEDISLLLIGGRKTRAGISIHQDGVVLPIYLKTTPIHSMLLETCKHLGNSSRYSVS